MIYSKNKKLNYKKKKTKNNVKKGSSYQPTKKNIENIFFELGVNMNNSKIKQLIKSAINNKNNVKKSSSYQPTKKNIENIFNELGINMNHPNVIQLINSAPTSKNKLDKKRLTALITSLIKKNNNPNSIYNKLVNTQNITQLINNF